MSLTAHWFLPTTGDSRDIAPAGDDGHARPPSLEHLAQIARAAEEVGFTGALTPTGTWCEESWITTAALLGVTQRLRFLVAFRPGSITPTLAAQMASSYQRHSGGRLLLNVVTGGEDAEQRRFGDHLGKAERYERTGEFLKILRGAWSGEPFDFAGAHYTVEGATTRAVPSPVPTVYFGGASAAAEDIAVESADVYLCWGEPPEMLRERVARVRSKVAAAGRSDLRFGVRLHVIARDTSEEAWAETDRLLSVMDPKVVASTQKALAASQSEGQRRMAELHGGSTSKDALVVAPNLWAGVGLVRGGAGTALVGSFEEVAERISELHDIGFSEIILSGHPHLEEAYRVGEGLLPLLRRSGLLEDAPAPASTGPAGPVYVAAAR
jgi:alkanesulfonate monooxygenase